MTCCGKTSDRKDRDRWRPGCVLCRIACILGERKTRDGDPCVVIPGRLIRKPDPCIYDQFLLMQLNQPVSWDNPDIRIFLNGVERYTYDLTVSTVYDVEVTVHNASRDKPALGTAVDIAWIEFGAGAQTRHPIAVLPADVPIWPGTATVSVKWKTPGTPGHYCIEVVLSHADDGNPANNRGWNNTQVHAAHSSVTTPVRIFNRYPGECPPVREGGGPVLEPHRAFYGWGPLGAAAATLLEHHLADRMPLGLRFLALVAAGYVAMTIVGLIIEAALAAMQRGRAGQRRAAAPPNRADCHLVEITVDSYEFDDNTGKAFDPTGAFANKAPVWPAAVTPPSFVFLAGEAFRDVDLKVDAPDGPGPPASSM
jgi:hypothetical protein